MNVNHINAYNGGIKMYAGAGNVVGFGKTPEMIAYVLKTKGMADVVYGGSSMDFADENGFAHYGDANKLWDEALGIYNWEVNGVAG
jgi:hypothetical protein|tara:strand:+ start:361 stop:618 length:258 start_codon:yes stop_codon:yes gene_type:complete